MTSGCVFMKEQGAGRFGARFSTDLILIALDAAWSFTDLLKVRLGLFAL